MFNQIILNTPRWVWILLVALIWLGIQQSFTRRIRLGRVAGIALGMSALSLYGTVNAFGAHPVLIAAWLACVAAVVTLVQFRPLPAGTSYDADTSRFTVPGSWVPLMLILAIFLTKYAVGVSLALQPALRLDATLAAGITALYGLYSGVFLGRALRLLRLAQRQDSARLLAGGGLRV